MPIISFPVPLLKVNENLMLYQFDLEKKKLLIEDNLYPKNTLRMSVPY